MNTEILYRFFGGNATQEEVYSIHKWLEDVPENKKKFLIERKLYDLILLHAPENETKTETLPIRDFSTKRMFLSAMKYAAIIFLTLIITYGIQKNKESSRSMAMQTISVPEGQRINLTLPDGTKVWLNALTTLTYPTSFQESSKRSVILEGEAYFDVAHNEKTPFIVKTSKCQIEVLGTEFNVEAYGNANVFETTLMEGSIKLSANKYPNKHYILKPGTKAVLNANNIQLTKVEDYGHYRWKEGLISFKNESLQDIVDHFKKYYGLNFVIENDKIKEYCYTGKFRQSDGVDYALRVLQKDINFSYHRGDENNTIYIK